jgi:AcrR family transcriptional regulator
MTTTLPAKTRILGAAAAVVARSGAAHLTIDAVAAEAKLSKGGVLYHFPNKRSMLEGMVEHVLGRAAERSAEHQQQLAGGRNITIRSLILAQQEQDDDARAMSLAILAAAAEDPELLDPARTEVASWFEKVDREADGDMMSVLLLLATEGLRFLDMLDLLPLVPAERKRVHQRMLEIAGEESP